MDSASDWQGPPQSPTVTPALQKGDRAVSVYPLSPWDLGQSLHSSELQFPQNVGAGIVLILPLAGSAPRAAPGAPKMLAVITSSSHFRKEGQWGERQA